MLALVPLQGALVRSYCRVLIRCDFPLHFCPLFLLLLLLLLLRFWFGSDSPTCSNFTPSTIRVLSTTPSQLLSYQRPHSIVSFQSSPCLSFFSAPPPHFVVVPDAAKSICRNPIAFQAKLAPAIPWITPPLSSVCFIDDPIYTS